MIMIMRSNSKHFMLKTCCAPRIDITGYILSKKKKEEKDPKAIVHLAGGSFQDPQLLDLSSCPLYFSLSYLVRDI